MTITQLQEETLSAVEYETLERYLAKQYQNNSLVILNADEPVDDGWVIYTGTLSEPSGATHPFEFYFEQDGYADAPLLVQEC